MIERLGDFEILSELGRGGMATVWRARDTQLQREVALKEPNFPPGMTADQAVNLWQRFQKEARAQAQLSAHPNVVQIYGMQEIEGRRVIVMELVDAPTLAQRLTLGSLPANDALRVADELLSALAAAHEKGVVHRDVKPDNVFLTPTGAKLADFGIARLKGAADTAVTRAGKVMGTAGWMAPEQVRGAPVDSRADIFAVGVLIWQMIAGYHPFGADGDTDPTAIGYRIVHEPTPSLGVPELDWLDAVLAAATAKDPAARIPNAQAFRQALAARALPAPVAAATPTTGTTVGGTGVLPVAEPPTGPGTPSATRWALRVGGAVLVGLLLVGVIAVGATAFVRTGSAFGPGTWKDALSGWILGGSGTATESVRPVSPAQDLTSQATATSSSHLETPGGNVYSAEMAVDGSDETAWSEGQLGDFGVGEWVNLEFPTTMTVSEVQVLPGYKKETDDRWGDRWYLNARVKQAKLEFSDGTSVDAEFEDLKELQGVKIDPPRDTTFVRIRIESVYSPDTVLAHADASATDDTSVSEIRVLGYAD